jgi:SAM-dependent methyltransferase
MFNQIYEIESQIEEKHWWFVVRRQLFTRYINALNLDKTNAKILDIGSSSGTNLRMLKELGFKHYQGFDNNILSKIFCEKKNLGKVTIGDICENNFADNSFDLILATDVIEHIENDEKAIFEIKRILKPKGHAIITVPCFMQLWGLHDEQVMHKRRYQLKEISQKISKQNLQIIESYYFNFILFLPIFLFRKITKFLQIKIASENRVNNIFFNFFLQKIFTIDTKIAAIIKPVLGISAFLLIKK